MNKLNDSSKSLTDKLRQLEKENYALRDENRQLRSDNAAALFKLEQQVAIEKRYEESQSRFQTIFYKSKLGNKIIAPDLRIMQINEVFQVMLGYSEKEILGTRIIAFAHPDYIHHWHELQENLWTKKIPSFQIETCLIKKDGSVLWCQVTSIIFRDNEATLGYTIVEDISKRKGLELNLKKLYDNQETILHMVAHDLKNPIYNIQLACTLLKENYKRLPESENKAEIHSFLDIIALTSNQALVIIKDLLLIGEVERDSPALEIIDLMTFIQSQLPMLQVETLKKEIKISFQHPDEAVYAAINPDKFRRVIDNLFSNAIKFTNEGGQITILLKSDGQKVTLQVSDNGIGIPEKLQGSIFNKFTKANRIGTKGESTTGLGLYIAKLIVEKHNGKIWVESQENVGTSFFIQLDKCFLP